MGLISYYPERRTVNVRSFWTLQVWIMSQLGFGVVAAALMFYLVTTGMLLTLRVRSPPSISSGPERGPPSDATV